MALWRRRRNEPASIEYQRRNGGLTIVRAWDRRVIPPGAREFIVCCRVGAREMLLSWWAIDEEQAHVTFREWCERPMQVITHTPEGVVCPNGYNFKTALIDGWVILS